MAKKRRYKEINFTLKDDDYRSFGRYRIMYTEQGRKMVSRQRMTYIITAVMIAALFTLFHVDQKFTIIMYVLAGVLGIIGLFFAERLVLRQQDKAIQASENDAERVHRADNTVRFFDETFTTIAGPDEQTFNYKDVKQLDLTEEAIYVWMSDQMIMPLPRHAFRNMDEMKGFYKWLKDKIEENGGKLK